MVSQEITCIGLFSDLKFEGLKDAAASAFLEAGFTPVVYINQNGVFLRKAGKVKDFPSIADDILNELITGFDDSFSEDSDLIIELSPDGRISYILDGSIAIGAFHHYFPNEKHEEWIKFSLACGVKNPEIYIKDY